MTFDLGGNELRVGTTINNNPTVQDPYNSTFACGYPYVPSGVAHTPMPSRVLATGFNNIIIIGFTVFAWCDHGLNLEAGAYMTVGTWWLARLRQLLRRRSQGAIPYLRAAYEWD